MKAGKIDEYTLKARAFPAFITILPLALFLFPAIGMRSLWLGLAAPIGGTAIISFLLAQWGRDKGKLKEPKLFLLWGGKPTTIFLRHRNREENRIIRERRHRLLERLANGIVLPTVIAEAEDPIAADEAYEAATKVLIQRTRDKERFSLLFDELVSYGFRRNLWGLKPFGITILVIAFVLHLSAGMFLGIDRTTNFNFAVGDLVILLCWLVFVTPDWVYITAKAYSDRLFDALDQMVELDSNSRG
jgi:hypothetical protein